MQSEGAGCICTMRASPPLPTPSHTTYAPSHDLSPSVVVPTYLPSHSPRPPSATLTDETHFPRLVQLVDVFSENAFARDESNEPSQLLTPRMMEELQGTGVDAATAQRFLDDPSILAVKSQQAEERRVGAGGEEEGGRGESSADIDDSATISTVMAVAMGGRAIKPSLDVLQQVREGWV